VTNIFRSTIAGGALSLATLLGMSGEAAHAQALAKTRVLLPVTNIDEAYSPYVVAKEVGFFRDEGLDVEIVPISGGTQATIQVAAGNGDFSPISPVNLIVGIQPSIGMRVQLFHAIYYQNIWSVSVMPESPIKSLADLKGKKVGVASMGSSGVLYGTAYLARAGIQVGKDGTTFLPIGVGSQGATALRGGNVDGVVYWDAMLAKLDLAGLKLRQLPVDDAVRTLPDDGLGATPETLEKRPQVAVGFARAVAKGYEFTQANRDAAVRIVWKNFPESKARNVPDDEALKSALTVNQVRMAIWNSPRTEGKQGLFFKDDYERLIAFSKEFGLISQDAQTTPEQLYTNKFNDEINRFDRAAVRKAAADFDVSKLR
jgi:NitT/TauT family transport system substrate-binding protein